jgi:hypothetical protein
VSPVDDTLVVELQAALAPTFTLVRPLGAGGMGSVFLARDPLLKRYVAVKLLSPDLAADPTARARFQREAQAVASISHPNVVAVYSVGEIASGAPYFIMQYVDGRSMADRIESDGPLDVETTAKVLGQVASALAAAHKLGIIHRDIKPANVMWDEAGGRALVSDFGIAAVRDKPDETGRAPLTDSDLAADPKLTGVGISIGTPAYMSPEQLLAEDVTEKTDIYSLGLLGYELLTGAGPYTVSSPRELMAAHLTARPKKLSASHPDIDPELESLLESCLSKDANARPTAADASQRLAGGASVLLEWPPPGLEPLHGQLGRTATLIGVGSFLIVVPVILLGAYGRDSWQRALLPGDSFTMAIIALGSMMLVVAAGLLGRHLWRGAQLVRAGYGWLTVAETFADGRRDTGALIAGAREYASLGAARRGELRRRRLVAAALRFGGAAFPLLGVLATLLVFGSNPVGASAAVALALVLPAACLLASLQIASREAWHLRAARHRMRPVAAREAGLVSEVVAAWKDGFEKVRAGQRVGQGLFGRYTLLALSATAAAAALVALTALGVSASFVAIEGESRYASQLPRFENTQGKYLIALRALPYRFPVDSSISRIRAGEALHAIGRIDTVARYAPMEHRPVRPIIGPFEEDYRFYTEAPSELFQKKLWPYTAMRAAPRGFTTAQRAWLQRVAAHPGRVEMELLGRAGGLDYAGAALNLPFPPGIAEYQLPLPRMGHVRAVVHAIAAQAILDLEAGKRADAERRLRLLIGAGHAMIDDNLLITNLIGVVFVGIGQGSLAAYYEAVNQPDRAREVTLTLATVGDDDPARGARARGSVPAQVKAMRGAISNTQLVRGLRWEFATSVLPYEPCTDLRQLLFGPSASYLQTLALGRKHLVRSGSRADSILYDMGARALEHPMVWDSDYPLTVKGRLSRLAARVLDSIVGGRRFESCVSVAEMMDAAA